MNVLNLDGREVDLEILQGATFTKVFRWASEILTYKAVTGITQSAPPVITAASHGVPDGWPVKVSAVVGMDDINDDEWHDATVVTSGTISLKNVNAAGYDAYVSGGVLEYYTPVDLSGFTARAQIRRSIGASTTLLELTTENGGIAIDNSAKTITLTIAATATDDLTWRTAVYDLELVSGTGVVTRIASGPVTVSREVTR